MSSNTPDGGGEGRTPKKVGRDLQGDQANYLVVVAEKKGGKVRIYVDLTKLNQNICRERHIPTISGADPGTSC